MLRSAFFVFLQIAAFAQVSNGNPMSVFCAKSPIALEECAAKIHAALAKISCKVDTTATQCGYTFREDPNNPGLQVKTETVYCSVSSENCSKPHAGLFGGSTCYDSEKVSFLANSQVHLGYWTSALAYYSGASPSTVLCIER